MSARYATRNIITGGKKHTLLLLLSRKASEDGRHFLGRFFLPDTRKVACFPGDRRRENGTSSNCVSIGAIFLFFRCTMSHHGPAVFVCAFGIVRSHGWSRDVRGPAVERLFVTWWEQPPRPQNRKG